jgi:hypothetical protein
LLVKPPRGFFTRRDLKRSSSPATDRPSGEMPFAKSIGLEEKRPRGQRVLDGLSGVRAGGRSKAASNTASFENGVWSNMTLIPLGIQPPPLTAIAHGKLSFHMCFKFSRRRLKFKIIQSLRRALQPVHSKPPTCFALWRRFPNGCAYLSCLKRTGTRMSRLEKFRHRTTILILL